MALQGTLDTFSLDEVLALLAQTKKSGALLVTAPQRSGVLYVVDGWLCGAEGGDADDSSTVGLGNDEELEAALLDLTFGLFRLRTGEFEFLAERVSPAVTRERVAIEAILAQVRAVLVDWDAVESVITSPDLRPRLVSSLAADHVTIDRAAWRVLLVVDGLRTVREIAGSLRCSVVGASRALTDLVRAGAVEVGAVEVGAVEVGAVEVGVIDGFDLPVGTVDSTSMAMADPIDRALPESVAGELEETLETLEALAALDDATGFDDGRGFDDGQVLEDSAVFEDASEPEVELEIEHGDDAVSVAADLTPPDASVEDVDPELGPGPVSYGEPRDRGALLRMFSSLRDS